MTAPRPGQSRKPSLSPAQDVFRTNLFTVLGALAGLASFYWSLLFPMVGDSCPYNCRHPDLLMPLAYAVTWGGLVAAVVITARGTASARRSGRPLWTWPALSTALIVVTFVAGVFIADAILITR